MAKRDRDANPVTGDTAGGTARDAKRACAWEPTDEALAEFAGRTDICRWPLRDQVVRIVLCFLHGCKLLEGVPVPPETHFRAVRLLDRVRERTGTGGKRRRPSYGEVVACAWVALKYDTQDFPDGVDVLRGLLRTDLNKMYSGSCAVAGGDLPRHEISVLKATRFHVERFTVWDFIVRSLFRHDDLARCIAVYLAEVSLVSPEICSWGMAAHGIVASYIAVEIVLRDGSGPPVHALDTESLRRTFLADVTAPELDVLARSMHGFVLERPSWDVEQLFWNNKRWQSAWSRVHPEPVRLRDHAE